MKPEHRTFPASRINTNNTVSGLMPKLIEVGIAVASPIRRL